MRALHVADHRLDGGSASLLAADDLGDPAHLVRDPDPGFVRVIVAAITFINVDAPNPDAGQLLHLGDDGTEEKSRDGRVCEGNETLYPNVT